MPVSDPATFYVTVAEYKALSLQAGVSSMGDEAIKALILSAMSAVDAYVEDGWTRYDEDQEFFFPRDVDENAAGVVTIPRAIRDATVLIADALLQRRTKGVLPHELKSWSNAGHSYERFGSGGDGSFSWFPPEAVSLLARYRRLGGGFAVV